MCTILHADFEKKQTEQIKRSELVKM